MNTNTQKLIEEIRDVAGWSDYAIAKRLGVSQTTVYRLRTGADCKTSLVILINQLHKKAMRLQ